MPPHRLPNVWAQYSSSDTPFPRRSRSAGTRNRHPPSAPGRARVFVVSCHLADGGSWGNPHDHQHRKAAASAQHPTGSPPADTAAKNHTDALSQQLTGVHQQAQNPHQRYLDAANALARVTTRLDTLPPGKGVYGYNQDTGQLQRLQQENAADVRPEYDQNVKDALALAKVQQGVPNLRPGLADGSEDAKNVQYGQIGDMPLFGPDGPDIKKDLNQGGLGDCWVLSSVAAVAERDPSDGRSCRRSRPSTRRAGAHAVVRTDDVPHVDPGVRQWISPHDTVSAAARG